MQNPAVSPVRVQSPYPSRGEKPREDASIPQVQDTVSLGDTPTRSLAGKLGGAAMMALALGGAGYVGAAHARPVPATSSVGLAHGVRRVGVPFFVNQNPFGFAGVEAGNGLSGMGEDSLAREAYQQAARHGASEAGDRLSNMGEDSMARDAWREAARHGAVEAGDSLRNHGQDSEARDAYMDAARAGNADAGDRLNNMGESQLAEEAWRLAANATSHGYLDELAQARLQAQANWARVQSGDGLANSGDWSAAERIYKDAAERGSVQAGDRFRNHGDDSAARDAYRAAARVGNPEAGERLRLMGEDSEARDAFVAAAQTGGVYVAN